MSGNMQEGVEMKKKSKEEKRYFLGKIKIWQTRLTGYISMINFVMIFYLYIIEAPLDMPWYVWLIVMVSTSLIVLFFDVKFIFPETLKYQFNKNPEYVSLREKMDRIIELLEEQKIG